MAGSERIGYSETKKGGILALSNQPTNAMPHLSIQLSGPTDHELAARVAREITRLTADLLRKDANLVAITVQFVEPSLWFIANEPLSARGARSFFLEISVTDETNLKSEKARYHAAVFAAMSELLGGVDERSYCHVVDARAAAYGFGGITQESRYAQTPR